MNKKDLKKDDYYYAEYFYTNNNGNYCIVKGTTGARYNLYTKNNSFYSQNDCMARFNIRLATIEEKHWLDCCIANKKFISKEEAMKTFKPEYVECISTHQWGNLKIGNIYKVGHNDTILEESGKDSFAYWNNSSNSQFKPSTKELFDLQNKPKEQTIEDILEICKQKFPVGSKIKTVYDKNIIVMNHRIIEQGIYSNNGLTRYCIYSNSLKKYATLINSLPTNTESIKENTKTYTLEEIKTVLTKEYDKNDVIDIIKIIEKIK